MVDQLVHGFTSIMRTAILGGVTLALLILIAKFLFG